MSKERILIVDDEPKICGILTALIEKQGAEVKVVHTGEDALEINPVFFGCSGSGAHHDAH